MNIDERLNKFYDSVDIDELERLDMALCCEHGTDSAAEQRILSSAIRKAGITMNGNVTYTEKKNEKFKMNKARRIAVIAAAAAAVMAVTAVAAGVVSFTHRDSVSHYFGDSGAETLESMDKVMEYTSANEHFSMTIDTLMSDGRTWEAVVTLTALDERGAEWLDNETGDMPFAFTTYADNGEETPIFPSETAFWNEDSPLISDNKIKYLMSGELDGIDVSRDINFTFNAKGLYVEDSERLYEGISFTLDLSKNMETVELVSENGTTMQLSPFSIYGDLDFNHSDYRDVLLIKNDGSRERIDYALSCVGENYIHYGAIIDLDEYMGVEFCGEDFLRVEN